MKRKQSLTDTQKMSVRYHIRELRNRLTWVVLLFLAGGIAGYTYQVHIINFLRHYMVGSLYYTSPAGNFNFIIKVSVMIGALAAVPALIYHMIKFAQPALSAHHQYKRVWLVTVMSFLLALAGMAFAIWFILPVSLKFFAGFSVNGVEPLISADEYLNYVVRAITWFAILFQIPLLVLFINKISPLNPRQLLKYEKYVVVAAFAVALILPFAYDPVTQFVIAIPIIVLYNMSILLIWFSNRSAVKKKARHTNSPVNNPKPQTAQLPTVATSTPPSTMAPKTQPLAAVAQIKPRPVVAVKPQGDRLISDFRRPTRRPVNKRTVADQRSRTATHNRQQIERSKDVSMDVLQRPV